jgi:hypothetical protein
VTDGENVHMSWESRSSIMCPYCPSAEAWFAEASPQPMCRDVFFGAAEK